MKFGLYLEGSYHGNHAAGSNTVVESHPALVVWIVALCQKVLVAHVVVFLVDHPSSTVHLDGVAAAEVGVQVRALAAALIGAALKVSILVENDLSGMQEALDQVKHKLKRFASTFLILVK